MVKEKLTPAQIAKEEERKRQEVLAYERQSEAKREQKRQFALRILMLRDTYKILDGIYKDITKISATDEQQSLWSRYADCQNTPYGQRPTELRDYLYSWQQRLTEQQHDNFDWLLPVEERTLLDQSVYRVDLTERCLRAQQPDKMMPMRQRFADTLWILDEIDDVLGRKGHFHLSNQTAFDLGTIRADLQEQLRTNVDVSTFVITGNIDREMNLLDECRAEFVFSSDVFSIGLYTNRDVPLARLDALDSFKARIDFAELKVSVTCPRDMDFDGSVLRVVRFSFDHWSGYAPSTTITFEDAEYIRRNLLESSRQEADMLERMERNTLIRMRKERADFEAQQLAAQEEALLLSKNKNKEQAKTKKPKKAKKTRTKPVIEPPIVNENTILDMLPQYQQQEEEDHVDRLQTLQPDAALQLAPFELNQRQCVVLGGTYAVHYLERPVQSRKFSAKLFQRTHQQPDVLKYHPYATEYTPVSPIASDCSLTAVKEYDKRVRHATHQWENLIEITVQLPADVSWWTQPTVVRWQNWEDSDEFRALSPEMQYYNLHHEAIEAAKLAKLFKRRQPQQSDYSVDTDYLLDMDLANRIASPELKLYYLMTKHIVPRLSQTYRFEAERRETEEKYAAKLRQREHQRLEQMEDRMMRQQQEIDERAKKQAEASLEEETTRNNEETTSITEETTSITEETTSIAGETKSITDKPSPDEEDPDPEPSRTIVQGLPARELFPVLGRQAPLVIIPKIFRYHPAMLLSEQLSQIDEYNAAEVPRFKNTIKTGQLTEPSSSELSEEDEVEVGDEESITLKSGKRRSGSFSKVRETLSVSATPTTRKSTRLAAAAKGPRNSHERRSATLPLVPHCRGRWVTEGIHVQTYDETSRTITFKTTHIGTIGFAADKYFNLPLTEWEMKPNYDDIPMSVKIGLTGRAIKLEVTVSPHGFRVHMVRTSKDPLPLSPADAWISLAQLQHCLCSRNMSVFPDVDAVWYLPEHDADNETPVSYKHEPMANHSYACMGYFCQTHHFQRSVWNRLCARREALVSVRQVAENRQGKVEGSAVVLVQPGSASFVRVEELCTPIAEDVRLAYHPEPPEQEFSCDLFDLLNLQANDKTKKRLQNTDVQLRFNVIECLRAVQPLSYS